MLKGTKLYSVFSQKCPQCHEGDFFKGKIYTYSKHMGEVKDACDHCGLKYKLETGFYQGSYYVTYGLGVTLFVAVAVINILLGYTHPVIIFLTFVAALAFLVPTIYALSKIIWINLFVSYKKGKKQ